MSQISVVYNFDTPEEAASFLQRNPIGAAVAEVTGADKTATTPTGKARTTRSPKSLGPAVEGDPEGTRYWAKGEDLFKTPKELDATTNKLVDGATEISGVDYLGKKDALAAKKVADQGAAASQGSASTAQGAGGQSASGGADEEFDPFAEDAPGRTDATEAELMAALKALSNVKDGRAKLTAILTQFGDGKLVKATIAQADTPAKRVALLTATEAATNG